MIVLVSPITVAVREPDEPNKLWDLAKLRGRPVVLWKVRAASVGVERVFKIALVLIIVQVVGMNFIPVMVFTV